MDLDLLSQNLILIICSLLTAAAAVILINLFRINKQKSKTKKTPAGAKKAKAKTSKKVISLQQRIAPRLGLLIIIVAAVIIALLLVAFISSQADSALPGMLTLMLLPFTLTLGLLALVLFYHLPLRILASVGIVLGLLFTVLLINDYYRFYPTLDEVFNKNAGVTSLADGQKEAELQFATGTAGAAATQSIEGSLASLNRQPTKGQVYSVTIPGTVSKFHARTAYVYVPAIYNNPGHINLPVIVLTVGFPGLPENWLGSGLETTMDEFASHHDGITPLVFMVDNTGSLTNDSECVDSPRGNVETYLTVDVPNYIKDNFSVTTGANHWAIGGLSMGGMCAVMLALRHPTIYGYFLDFGGEAGPEVGSQQKTIDTLFAGSESNWLQHQPWYLLENHTYKGMGGFFGVGKQDELNVTTAAAQLSAASKKAGIETIYEVINGQHTFNVWNETFKLSLPWVSNRIGATTCGNACL